MTKGSGSLWAMRCFIGIFILVDWLSYPVLILASSFPVYLWRALSLSPSTPPLFFSFKMENMISLVHSCWKSSGQSLSHIWLFATPWIAACQASLSITNSRSLLRLTSIESVMPSSLLILCRPLLLLPQIPPSIRIFSNESTLRMRWPKYWSTGRLKY